MRAALARLVAWIRGLFHRGLSYRSNPKFGVARFVGGFLRPVQAPRPPGPWSELTERDLVNWPRPGRRKERPWPRTWRDDY